MTGLLTAAVTGTVGAKPEAASRHAQFPADGMDPALLLSRNGGKIEKRSFIGATTI